MKRGNIFLLISIIIVIAIAFYISSSLTGKITLEDSSINNNVNLEPIQYPTTIEGCLDIQPLLPEAACTNKKTSSCTERNNDGRCVSKREFGEIVSCLYNYYHNIQQMEEDAAQKRAGIETKGIGIGTCCLEAGDIANTYHSGMQPCCKDVEYTPMGDEGAGEAKKITGSIAKYPNENFDGPQELKCCAGNLPTIKGTYSEGNDCYLKYNGAENGQDTFTNQIWTDDITDNIVKCNLFKGQAILPIEECEYCPGDINQYQRGIWANCGCDSQGNDNAKIARGLIGGSQGIINEYCKISSVCRPGSRLHSVGKAIDIACTGAVGKQGLKDRCNRGAGTCQIHIDDEDNGWTCSGSRLGGSQDPMFDFNDPSFPATGAHIHCFRE